MRKTREVRHLRNLTTIQCVNFRVAANIAMQLNRVGVPKKDGHYVRDTVTWVVTVYPGQSATE